MPLAAAALRNCVGAFDAERAEMGRLALATGAGGGFACACCAAAFALRRAISILRICSGVGGFGGSLPAERVARGGVRCLSAMLSCSEGLPNLCMSVSVDS
jgi:hypothetical protein